MIEEISIQTYKSLTIEEQIKQSVLNKMKTGDLLFLLIDLSTDIKVKKAISNFLIDYRVGAADRFNNVDIDKIIETFKSLTHDKQISENTLSKLNERALLTLLSDTETSADIVSYLYKEMLYRFSKKENQLGNFSNKNKKSNTTEELKKNTSPTITSNKQNYSLYFLMALVETFLCIIAFVFFKRWEYFEFIMSVLINAKASLKFNNYMYFEAKDKANLFSSLYTAALYLCIACGILIIGYIVFQIVTNNKNKVSK